jgi:hypothetical protein
VQAVKGNRAAVIPGPDATPQESHSMNRYLKAITGAVIAGLTSLQASLEGGLTAAESITAAIAALVALGAVWAIPNSD